MLLRPKSLPPSSMIYCLAPQEWQPGESVLAPYRYGTGKYWARDEATIRSVRVFTTAVNAVWSNIAWKQGPVRPWLIEASSRGLDIFKRTPADHFSWVSIVPAENIIRASRHFDWHVCWPNEIRTQMLQLSFFDGSLDDSEHSELVEDLEEL
jgi:hypothetical protein